MKILLFIIIVIFALLLTGCMALLLYVFILMHKRPLLRLYESRRAEEDFCPLPSVPERFLGFLLQIEDDKFFEHPGFSVEGIRYAFSRNLRTGRIEAGGSTITQQLVKNLYFTFYHSYIRKAAEFAITLFAERSLGKEKILEFYLNIIYFGSGVYGITHAARFFFGKEPLELTVNEMFMMACMPYAPTVGNPVTHPDVFERVRNRRVNRLLASKKITADEADMIRSFHADCLDPDLRGNDSITRNYPTDVCMSNDRFGPSPRKERVTIP